LITHGSQLISLYRDETNVQIPDPIAVVHTGRRGHPQKVINLAYLTEAMAHHHNITISGLVRVIGVHCHTLRYYMNLHGVHHQFSALSNADLDLLVKRFKHVKPEAGIRYLVGFLRSHGLRVQWRRVVSSLKRVDPVGQVLHQRKAVQRRKYSVQRPNSLWHLDGHHKLISWGIVIHVFIDGYSRTV
jgi:hypothetical protein